MQIRGSLEILTFVTELHVSSKHKETSLTNLKTSAHTVMELPGFGSKSIYVWKHNHRSW